MTLQESYASIKNNFELLRSAIGGGEMVVAPAKVQAQLELLALDLSEAAMLAAEVRLNVVKPSGKAAKYGAQELNIYAQSEEISALVKVLQYNVRMILDARKLI